MIRSGIDAWAVIQRALPRALRKGPRLLLHSVEAGLDKTITITTRRACVGGLVRSRFALCRPVRFVKGVYAICLLSVLGVAASAQELAITPAFKTDQYLPRTQAIELLMNRSLLPADGRLALFFDQTDLTSLFSVAADRIIYQPEKLPLPAGEHQLVVYLVSPENGWREIGRAQMKILSRRGFEKAIVKPAADFTGKAQPFSDHAPDTNQPERATFQDGTVQMTIHSEHVRPGFTIKSDGQITGVTYRNEALRFGQIGEDAPPIDLSAYRVDLQRGSTILSVGHLGFGSLRHLVNGFSSRGVALKFGEGRRLSLQLAALNGSSIVGWDNFLGLNEDAHRILGATIGLELIPSRPRGLLLEGTVFGGSLLPFSGFNQGAVRASEKSEGVGLRLVATSPSQRFTVDSGYTGSTFHEARDEEVEDGLAVTPIPTQTNNAQYLDASVVLLQNRTIRKVAANLTLSAHHERIEPLFRSVGAAVQADLQTDSADLTGSIGVLTAQLSHVRARDNIGGVESILTTKTRRTAIGLGIPISGVIRSKRVNAIWFPTLTVQTDLTHQFGTGVPVNSGFTESDVPDQMSRNASASLQWQLGRFQVGYRLAHSNQDNRQIGREAADFNTVSNALTLGFLAGQRFNASLDLSLDQNENELEGRRDRTQRYGTTVNWTLFGQTALGATLSTTSADNNFATLDQRGTIGYLELSSGFALSRNAAANRQGRVFVRYSEQQDRSRDSQFGFDSDRRGATVSSGLTLSVH